MITSEFMADPVVKAAFEAGRDGWRAGEYPGIFQGFAFELVKIAPDMDPKYLDCMAEVLADAFTKKQLRAMNRVASAILD
jgi:hypothetical protein